MAYQLGMLVDRNSTRLLYAKVTKQTVEVTAYEKYAFESPFDMKQSDSYPLIKSSLDDFMKKHKIKKKEITLLIQSKHLILNTLSVSYSSQKDMEKKMNASLASFFPFSLSDYAVDYRFLLSPLSKATDFCILILGLPNTLVQHYLHLCTALQVKPLRFDALVSAMLMLFPDDTRSRIVIDISTEQACILFLKNGSFLRYQYECLAACNTDGWEYLVQAVAEGLRLVQKSAAVEFAAEEITLLGCAHPDEKLLSLLAIGFSLPIRTFYEPKWIVFPKKEIASEACLLAAAMR